MRRLFEKNQAGITGTIPFFDPILFDSQLHLGWPEALEQFISRLGLRIKDFKVLASQSSERVKEHARAIAQQAERSYIRLNDSIHKEARAQKLDQITEDLVCILAAVESCRRFKIAYQPVAKLWHRRQSRWFPWSGTAFPNRCFPSYTGCQSSSRLPATVARAPKPVNPPPLAAVPQVHPTVKCFRAF